MCWRDSNLFHRKYNLSCANISLLMFLWCIFSKALRGSRSISLFRFDKILCILSKNEFSATGLWPESRKKSDWLTSRWMFCSDTELLTPKLVKAFSVPNYILPPLLGCINPATIKFINILGKFYCNGFASMNFTFIQM